MNNRCEIDVECNLSVSMDTAECALKLVEIFLNANSNFGIRDKDNEDGTLSLRLIDYDKEATQADESDVMG